jgi:uncharacterized membrane protein (Fun14 family)
LIESTVINAGVPLVGGGVTGFAIGYALKKLIKIAIIGLGLILALIAYLEYRRWISANWDVVQNQTGAFIEHSMQQVMDTVNNTARELEHNNLDHIHSHIDPAFPVLGITGFVPGLVLGLSRG